MDYHLTWYKCCPHWDDVQWPWLRSIPQRSRSHNTFKGQNIHACVPAITYICIDGLPSNLVQMLSSLRQCAHIQEYLGYWSNNLYFLFSHSWPVVVYNFGQVQSTSQDERKTKCSKKITARDIAVLWTALLVWSLDHLRYGDTLLVSKGEKLKCILFHRDSMETIIDPSSV